MNPFAWLRWPFGKRGGSPKQSEALRSSSPTDTGRPSKSRNEWLGMLDELQKSIRVRTTVLLSELEHHAYTTLQLHNLANAIVADMSALVTVSQTQLESLRTKASYDQLEMLMAFSTLGGVIHELNRNALRYAQMLQLTNPRLPAVSVRQEPDSPSNQPLKLPSPDPQDTRKDSAVESGQQPIISDEPPALQALKNPVSIVSNKADKVAKELQNMYVKALETARVIQGNLAGKPLITRMEVSTAMSRLGTLIVWLIKEWERIEAKYASRSS
jgi:hypothetical protein